VREVKELEAMKHKVECYYVFYDLHGPDSTYQLLLEMLNTLGAKKLDFGFPMWMFVGEADAHDLYRAKFEALLPPASIHTPEVSYCFLLMSSRGYTSCGEYKPSVGLK
jgi:hypothetical protein